MERYHVKDMVGTMCTKNMEDLFPTCASNSMIETALIVAATHNQVAFQGLTLPRPGEQLPGGYLIHVIEGPCPRCKSMGSIDDWTDPNAVLESKYNR